MVTDEETGVIYAWNEIYKYGFLEISAIFEIFEIFIIFLKSYENFEILCKFGEKKNVFWEPGIYI
jgi:hypothetical protein